MSRPWMLLGTAMPATFPTRNKRSLRILCYPCAGSNWVRVRLRRNDHIFAPVIGYSFVRQASSAPDRVYIYRLRHTVRCTDSHLSRCLIVAPGRCSLAPSLQAKLHEPSGIYVSPCGWHETRHFLECLGPVPARGASCRNVLVFLSRHFSFHDR